MKILYCITSGNWGGAQEHLFQLVKNESQNGNSIFLIMGNKGELYKRILGTHNVKIIILSELERSLNIFKDIRCIMSLRKLIKKIDPDIVHLHSSKAGAVGRIASFGLNCKVIFTVHGWAFTEGVTTWKRKFYVIIERLLYKLTDEVICVSNYDYQLGIKERVLKKEGKGIVIHNGIDTGVDFNNSKIISSDQFVIVMVARFDIPKRQDILIRAISLLGDNVHLILIGDGPRLELSKKLSLKLGVSNKVDFLGFQRDVGKYLKDANVFALISDYEGLPISIIEAMKFGLPIIASNVGGVPELVKLNGILVNNQVNEVCDSLNYLSTQHMLAKKMGDISYNLFQNEFTLHKQLILTHKIYVELLSEKR